MDPIDVTYTIKKGEPLPGAIRNRWNFPIEDLEPGDMVEIATVEEESSRRCYNSARHLVNRYKKLGDPRAFRISRMNELAFGIWRLR